MNLEGGIRFLAAGGLNLVSVLDVHELPDQIKHLVAGAGVPLTDYRRLVLIGHGGRRMWEKLQEGEMMPPDPVDRCSQTLTGRFIRDYLDYSPVLWLYPDARYLVALQQMGEAAGWSFPSPLGTGISPVYGVWFAYRAAFLTDAELAPTREAAASPPCDACAAKQCIAACPAGAVRTAALDSDGCARHRLSLGSPCVDRCLARLACPKFPEHRYGLSQIQYHYRHSLETIRAWYNR